MLKVIMNYFISSFFKKTILFLYLIVFISSFSIAQTKTDTLEIAKELRNQKKFNKAISLLITYKKSHPNDLNTIWLLAETYFWIKDIKTADEQFSDAIKLFPENLYLQIDYAKMLFNIGDFKKAVNFIDKFLLYYPLNEEALMMKAHIDYWQGNFDEANNTLQSILKNSPDNKKAISLLDEIQIVISPWLKLKSGYSNDDQPLQSISSSIEGGMYFNSLANISFNFQSPFFIRDNKGSSAQWFQINNKSELNNLGLKIIFTAGVLKFPSNNFIDWTGSIELNKTLSTHLNIIFEYERLPYFYTRSSLVNNLMVNELTASIELNKSRDWNGKVSYIRNQFPDNNSTSVFYGWLFTPYLKFAGIEIRLGYEYNYTTSQENRFISQEPLSYIVANYNFNDLVPGIYDPYFTANDQQRHSILASLMVHPSGNIEAGINASYGISASTLNPFLTLVKDNNGTAYIKRDFAEQNFSPMRISTYALIHLNNKVSLKTEYEYQKSNFYNYHYVAAELKINFWE